MVRVTDPDLTNKTTLNRALAVLYLAIGVLLVLSPVVIGSFGTAHEPRPSYTYEAVEVTVQNGSLAFDGPPPEDGIEGIDCVTDYSRLCGLEVDQLDGNVTVEKVNPITGETAQYVEFFDQYYRRVHHRNASHITYGLEQVSAQTVLESISVPIDQTEDPVAVGTIIGQTTGSIDHKLSTPEQVVAVEGSYYLFNFQRAETPRDTSGRTAAIPFLLSGLGVILGVWSLRKGWIRYDRWRGRE